MLSAEQLDAYRHDGFVVVRGVLSAGEIATLADEHRRLWQDANAELDRPDVHWRSHESLGRIPDRLDPVHPLSERFARLAADERMTTLAAAVLAAPCAFFKDKLITKPPGAFGYGLHHDFAYWSELGVPASDFVTLMVAIDACDEQSGALELFPGLHERSLAADARDPLDLAASEVEGWPSLTPTLAGGDVLVFHSLMPHRSAPNRSTRSRRVYIASYTHERHRGRADLSDPEQRRRLYRTLARDVA